MYTAPRLIELLERQHQARSQAGLFKKGTFTLQWRSKVGSFPYPDLETIVSAGEPCGLWKWNPRDFGQINERSRILPLNGYIPGSAIRGIVRAWAKKRPEITPRMLQLLGNQEDDSITAGKIEFLDAWPAQPTQLTLDIVNPQQEFQVYHQGQGTPLSFYTLGDGSNPLNITVAIRGIPGRATESEVDEVWKWVQQALSSYGVGSRTASGYGMVKAPRSFRPDSELRRPDYGCSVKQFEFTLYSQGCYGIDNQNPELRPSHWRGWLRSWIWRFLLGVMSEADAQKTLGELMGTLDAGDGSSRQGCVRLQMSKGQTNEFWGDRSDNRPYFYVWKGTLKITAPSNILNKIILPIIKFAVMVGGVGRGWRRPLHIFTMNTGNTAARGSYLSLTHKVKKQDSDETETKPFRLTPKPDEWKQLYQNWRDAVQNQWSSRFAPKNTNLRAEVFSPDTCAVYLVPAPEEEPLDKQNSDWAITQPLDTRGKGMELIYQPQYKRRIDVGGNAAGGGNAHCSWVSIKRVEIPNRREQTDCQEIVCLFMGDRNNLRSQFLRDLANIPSGVHLFGVKPTVSN